MYTRNFQNYSSKQDEKIPIELFQDSFTTKAFENMTDCKPNNLSIRKEAKNMSDTKSETLPPRSLRSFTYDDLLIIGLILMFLFDDKKNNDIVIPVLLAILLLS